MRCAKCLMPSSLPNSRFNAAGECWWCQTGFPPYAPKGPAKLLELLKSLKKSGAAADCLVGLSGGKDSSYVLLELKENFGMRAEAFTYSHFGLTSFALENAINVCKSLGVKHHILALPGDEHLRSFRSFFEVWVKTPRPVPAALTCVACKHLHILGTELAVKQNIGAIVWATCPLEIPPFLPLKPEPNDINQFKREGMIKSAVKLAKEMTTTKGLTSSIIKHFHTCTAGCMAVTPASAFMKFRYPSKKQIFFFDYCDWNPSLMVKKLTVQTAWKRPGNVPDDWHSDCLFNVFKEYMFQKMHGISYTDAFLSNQIRYGLMNRKEALKLLVESKSYYLGQLLKTLDLVGLKHLSPHVDPSCFNITE